MTDNSLIGSRIPYTFLLSALTLALLAISVPANADTTTIVSFDSLNGYTNTTPDGSYFNGYSGVSPGGSWSTDGVRFNTGTNDFGAFGAFGGWSYSNVNNTATAGSGNQHAAITGSGIDGVGNYALANGDGAFFDLPENTFVNSLSISNTTYAYLAMRDGNDGSAMPFVKTFGGATGNDPDFFKVTFTGYSDVGKSGATTGTEEFFLADYRFTDNTQDYVIDVWTDMDLTALGNARSVAIAFDGSDVGAFGLNTPAYIAIDNLSITAVPEPASVLMLAACGGVVAWRRRRSAR